MRVTRSIRSFTSHALVAVLAATCLGGIGAASAAIDTPEPNTPPTVMVGEAPAPQKGGGGMIDYEQTACAVQPQSVAKFKLYGDYNGAWHGSNDRITVTYRYTNTANSLAPDMGTNEIILGGTRNTQIQTISQCYITTLSTPAGYDDYGWPIFDVTVVDSWWQTEWSGKRRNVSLPLPGFNYPVYNEDGSFTQTYPIAKFIEARGGGTSVPDCRGYCWDMPQK